MRPIGKMRLLDLFCCQGGGAKGYLDSGMFDYILGIDIEPQPRYPFNFFQYDVMKILEYADLSWFDLVHISPPCQGFSQTRHLSNKDHPDLLTPSRELIKKQDVHWVIENVPNAPMSDYTVLCGTMFGLPLKRHRWFETDMGIHMPPFACACKGLHMRDPKLGSVISSFANGADIISVSGKGFSREDAKVALGIDWMTMHGMAQSIPPAYTEYLSFAMFSDMVKYLEHKGWDQWQQPITRTGHELCQEAS